jgi:hypothetical protein
MNKWALAVGIILVIVSPVLLTSYKTVYATPVFKASLAGDARISSWECSGTFAKDDVIFADIRPDLFWFNNSGAFDVLDNPPGMAVFYVDINITDPKNTVSQYELWYTYDPTQSIPYAVYNVSVLSLGEGINNTVYLPNQYNVTYTFYAGRALLDGTYFANVTSAGWPYDYRIYNPTAPPSYFALSYGRTTLELSQPYSSLLYVGYVTIPAGVIFLVCGLKTGKPIRKASSKRLHQLQLRRKNSAQT